ncbi:Fungal lipase-like domain-containing protein [Entamoeba marina]
MSGSNQEHTNIADVVFNFFNKQNFVDNKIHVSSFSNTHSSTPSASESDQEFNTQNEIELKENVKMELVEVKTEFEKENEVYNKDSTIQNQEMISSTNEEEDLKTQEVIQFDEEMGLETKQKEICKTTNTLLNKIYLTKQISLCLLVLCSLLIFALLYWFVLSYNTELITTSFFNFVIPISIFIIIFLFSWLKRIPTIDKILETSIYSCFSYAKQHTIDLFENHPTAMKWVQIMYNCLIIIISFIMLFVHYYLQDTTDNVLHTLVHTIFDLFGLTLQLFLLYMACIFIFSFFSKLTINISYHLLVLPLFPTIVSAYYICIPCDSYIIMFSLVFVAIISATLFIVLVFVFPLIFFLDKNTPLELKNLLYVIPVVVIVLFALLLSWLLLFLPGNSEYLPINNFNETDSSQQSLLIGHYNKAIKYYSYFNESTDLRSHTIDLSQILVFDKSINSNMIDVSGKIFDPIALKTSDVLFIIPPQTTLTSVIDGYNELSSYLASHNIAVVIVNITSLGCINKNCVKSNNPILPDTSAELLALSYLLMHHVLFITDTYPQIENIHFMGHGIGANVIYLTDLLSNLTTLPGFSTISIPQISKPITSLIAVSPSDETHSLLSSKIDNVHSLIIQSLSSQKYYTSINPLEIIEYSNDYIQTSLTVYGACSNRFNTELPLFDNPSNKWEINRKSLLSQETHIRILKNMVGSFLLSQHNNTYLERLITYQKNGLYNLFCVNTFLKSSKQLFNFVLPFDQQHDVNVTISTSYYVDLPTKIAFLNCQKSPCNFTLYYKEPITNITNVYIDITPSTTSNITFIVNEQQKTIKQNVVPQTKLTKFSKQDIPLENLLQTQQLTCADTYIYSFSIIFTTPLYIANLYAN